MKYDDAKEILDQNPIFELSDAMEQGISKNQFDKWEKEKFPEEEEKEKVEESKPDYVGYDKFISAYVESTSAEKLQAIAEGMDKFNVGKTEANKLLNDKVTALNKERRAEAKQKLDDEKEKARIEKEYTKREKQAEKEAEDEQKKLLLDEIEETWETADDELFQAVCEADWRKAKHYFAKRLLKEHSYIVDEAGAHQNFNDGDEGIIVGVKTFQDNKELIIYNPLNGKHEQEGEIVLSQEIEKRLGEKSTNMQVKEIIDSIKRQTYINRDILTEQPKHLRPVGNGILNILTKELTPFTPEYIFFSSAPNWNPTADYSRFRFFLTQVLDTEKEIAVIQEWLGYCLLMDSRFSKALLLFGDGENGKSVLLNLIKKFLGSENVTSISLQYLESNPFAPVRLFGKTANIFADLPKKALGQTSVFKMVVAGDSISGEKKGKDSFEYEPYAKMMFSCNEVPRTPDRTRGFFRRWIILKFNQHFPEGDPRRDEQLFEKLSTQENLEGMLKFAVEGLDRLLEQKGFTQHMTRAEIEEFWLRHSDSVAAFNLDLVEMDSCEEESKSNVYDTYESYCKIKGYPAEEPNAFWRRFKEICEYQESRPKSDTGSLIRVCKGFKLRSLETLSKGNGGQDE